MNFVEPIRDRKKIAQIKNLLRGQMRFRDLLLFVVGINDALEPLEELLELAGNNGWGKKVVEILALQTLAYDADGRAVRALSILERAFNLAEPRGYIRIFVDEGQPMAHLLYEALNLEVAPEYVRRLLSAFPATPPQGAASTINQVDQSGSIEQLSEREFEVLQLIAKGLTNQIIATRLFLSVHTIKTHTRNIYGKLAVNNRTQAVNRARPLGILPPT